VLTLEDDIEPPPDAIRRLGEYISSHAWRNYAAVGGAYDMGDGALCAGRADGGWGSPIYWHQVSDEPIDVGCIDVGCIGGGCTLWANWVSSARRMGPPDCHDLGTTGLRGEHARAGGVCQCDVPFVCRQARVRQAGEQWRGGRPTLVGVKVRPQVTQVVS
jgi:hypothetical protein